MSRDRFIRDTIVIRDGGVEVQINGLRQTIRAMEQAGAEAESMKDLMHALGTTVIRRATPPVKTGRMAATARAGRGKTKAVVRAGRAGVPYAGVVHYGWPARNIAPNPWLTTALEQSRELIYAQLDRGIGEILKRHGL